MGNTELDKITPHSFQKGVVKHLLEKKDSRVLLALDMGLGKTITSLYWVHKRTKIFPIKVLIIAQGDKLLDWKKEINKSSFIESASIRMMNIHFKAKKYQQIVPNAKWDVILTTYGTFPNHYKKMKSHINPETFLIVDESQTLKSSKTNIGKAVGVFSPYWKGIALLSGNPMGNGYEGFFNQLKILGETMKEYHFKQNFCVFKEIYIGARPIKIIVGYKNVEALESMISKYAIYMKTSAALTLPKQNHKVISFGNKYASLLNWKISQTNVRVYKDIMFDTIASLYLMWRRITNASIPPYQNVCPNKKLKMLEELINETTDNFVIFYNFNCELDTLVEYFKKNKIKTFQINGSKKEYHLLSGCKERHMVLIQYQSGSKGLNLQNYTRLIQYSPTTSYDNYSQSLKRIHRVGQTKPVFYYYLIMSGSIEEKIRQSNLLKEDYTKSQFENELLKFNNKV